MPDSPHASLPPNTIAEHQIMRRSLLSDLGARIASAGGVADYVYTTPRPEIDEMRSRVATELEQPAAAPAAARVGGEIERLREIGGLLGTECACRDLVAHEPLRETGELIDEFPAENQATMQRHLAERLAYHEAKLAGAGRGREVAFNHLRATVSYHRHLVAQQFNAYERDLEIVPSKHTQAQLGEQVHHELTSWVVTVQGRDRPGVGCQDGLADWQASNVAERLAAQSDYVKAAVTEYCQLRHRVTAATGQGVYPAAGYRRPGILGPEWDGAARVVDAGVERGPSRAATLDMPRPTRESLLGVQAGDRPIATPAREAYLDARAQAGAVGVALADTRMRRALILDRLQHDHARIATSLPEGYDTNRRPPAWRVRERSEWQRHQATARTIGANIEWQEQLRSELGPNSEQLVRRAVALTEAREQILASTPELQRNAIDEELAREPDWLTETLGPRPEQGAGRWRTLARQMAANRMRFMVADDADPGIRPEQSQLAQQVAQFQAEAGLAQSMPLAPGLGLGM